MKTYHKIMFGVWTVSLFLNAIAVGAHISDGSVRWLVISGGCWCLAIVFLFYHAFELESE